MYIDCPLLDNDRFNRVVRRCFRLPYDLFQALVAMAAQEDALIRRWATSSTPALNALCSASWLRMGVRLLVGEHRNKRGSHPCLPTLIPVVREHRTVQF